jgi:regulator of cell morphogenesis and NO signaling
MQPIITRLEDLARKAPDAARGLLRRLRAYRDKRSETHAAPAHPPAPAPAAATAEPVRPRKQNWELRSQAELVDHIEQHYHAGLRRDLPTLIDAARKIEREHASHAAVPSGLSDLLAELHAELESHMLKEETMLFPVLRTGSRGGQLDMPMRMMEREHDNHADQLGRIRALTHDLALPDDASPAWTTLYAGLATLETDLQQHIYLENNILFARASGGVGGE